MLEALEGYPELQTSTDYQELQRQLTEVEDGALRLIGGVVNGLQRKWTKKGDLMAVFTLEDLQSSIEVMVAMLINYGCLRAFSDSLDYEIARAGKGSIATAERGQSAAVMRSFSA